MTSPRSSIQREGRFWLVRLPTQFGTQEYRCDTEPQARALAMMLEVPRVERARRQVRG